MPRLGPHSRATAFSRISPRSVEGRLFHSMREELMQHVGPGATTIQKLIVERACWLRLHLALMDRSVARGEVLSEETGKKYLTWNNSLARLIQQLPEKPPQQRVSLQDRLANRPASPASAA